jgi:hypothetical protein
MSTEELFIVMLEDSKTEQLPVNIYLSYHLIKGVVTNVYPTSVELRTADSKRCIVSLSKIEAITAS